MEALFLECISFLYLCFIWFFVFFLVFTVSSLPFFLWNFSFLRFILKFSWLGDDKSLNCFHKVFLIFLIDCFFCFHRDLERFDCFCWDFFTSIDSFVFILGENLGNNLQRPNFYWCYKLCQHFLLTVCCWLLIYFLDVRFICHGVMLQGIATFN